MKHNQQHGQKQPATAMHVRNLARYDGRTFMGAFKITERRCGKRIIRQVVAKDCGGKIIGNFNTQNSALTAIDGAFEKRAMRCGSSPASKEAAAE